MWIAAAVLGLVTALGVRAFIWGYETINRLTVGAASTLPAPLGPVLVVLTPAVGGILVALWMHAFTRPAPLAKRWWGHVPLPFWAKTGLAGLLIGVVSLWVPQVTGTGLHQMQSIFSGQTFPITALLALAVAKLLLTPTTLGSGFVGGVIGPALAIGAALGAAYGMVVAQLIPGTAMPPVAFAMVATAAMLAGTFHAPLFGAMMMYEMSGDYRLLLPLLFAAAIGYGVARWFQPGSAYTFLFKSLGISLRPGTFEVGPPTRLE